MRIAIDASNIRDGGGITHLVEILKCATPDKYGIEEVHIWASQQTLNKLDDRAWLKKHAKKVLEYNFLFRAFWQKFILGGLVEYFECKLLFVPGGSFATRFRPVVTMSRNMLPFEWRELTRYGFSITALRLALLRYVQSKSFKKASGTIFLTNYAREIVTKAIGQMNGQIETIPHGVDSRFKKVPRSPKSLDECSLDLPFRVLYISIVDVYKHQDNVSQAIAALRSQGLPIALDLIGPSYPPALDRLEKLLKKIDPNQEFIRYRGAVPHKELNDLYEYADMVVFASSCENMPNILLEGMASGSPIACSDRGPMPEVLADAGIYFDPENIESISKAILELASSIELRQLKANAGYRRAQHYTWSRCADETFRFLASVAREQNKRVID